MTVYVYDDSECRKDILDWSKDRIDSSYCDIRDTEEEFNELIEKCNMALDNGFYFYPDDFCKENDCKEIEDLLDFTYDLLQNTDEYEWISYLRRNTDRLQNFDEVCESSLWNAGKTINQTYFVCMYALQVCGEKLKEQKGE